TRQLGGKDTSPQTRVQFDQIYSYKRPFRVAISGCRESSVQFSDFITSEMKRLPRHSVILVGDCTGVDKNATELAKELGIKVRVFKADWSQGKIGGPLRNTAI